ncbi:DUF2004 domain-containing protein [Epilithonimonas sp. JDS]|uniref:DUF2004 domain-containing protein n=1 Tax=Epilithonimonas sp. JDS TaxID=2902797 RepID=UPI001E512FF0|nr:DUF2004 domain-containing protein [Epilithonimonas sp. JDS]MCD9854892.1 DUF2004 domain-containing protein [Epilithonimonas sp. JDS]
MAKYILPPIGEIDLDSLKDYYCWEQEFNGKIITIDINFEKTNIDQSKMDIIKSFIENISKFDVQNRSYIDDDFRSENSEVVKEYVTFHVEDLGSEFLETIGISSENTDKEQSFLEKLFLSRIGFYPDEKYGTPHFAVFDYTFGRDITDQLIVVNTDAEGNLDLLSWES